MSEEGWANEREGETMVSADQDVDVSTWDGGAATQASWPRSTMTPDQLRAEVEAGHIDTVIVAITDIQGRLMGKRLPADLFLSDMNHGVHISSSVFVYDNDWEISGGFPEIG